MKFDDPTAENGEEDQEEIRFHDAPLPIVDLQVTVEARGQTPETIEVLVDSGASLNLITAATAARITRILGKSASRDSQASRVTLPTIRVASGAVIKAAGSVELFVKGKGMTEATTVTFFIFPDLPVQAIIGHTTNLLWKAVLSWRDRSWEVKPAGMAVKIPWKKISGKHWRAPVQVTVAQETAIPPMSHAKVQVAPHTEVSLRAAGFQGSFGIVAPHTHHDDFLLAHGVAEDLTWVQIANPTHKTIVLKVGQHVGDFHPREGLEVREIDITPTREEMEEEQERKMQRKKNLQDKQDSDVDMTHFKQKSTTKTSQMDGSASSADTWWDNIHSARASAVTGADNIRPKLLEVTSIARGGVNKST